MIARVAILSEKAGPDKCYDYKVPETLLKTVKAGMRAEVPFGARNQKTECIIVSLLKDEQADPAISYKILNCLTDEQPIMTLPDIETAWRIKRRCLCSYAEALRMFAPPGTGMKYEEWLHLSGKYENEELFLKVRSSALQETVVRALLESGGAMTYRALLKQTEKPSLRTTVNALLDKGIITVRHSEARSVRDKTVRLLSYCGEMPIADAIDAVPAKASGQKRVLTALRDMERLSASDLMTAAQTGRSTIDTLLKNGWLKAEEVTVLRRPSKRTLDKTEPPKLTKEQDFAVKKISHSIGKNDVFVLRGVTGSGKTEVFLRVIDKALKERKTALVLVPEIGLTPQMTQRFSARFGDNVAILHSALGLGERYDEWKRIRSGDAKVVIGTRSAVFAPLSNIGIIVIDEEHDTSYKSEMPPRYDARFVALLRAKQHGAVVVLASATPSVESYARAKTGEYTLINMQTRINRSPLPEVEIVDMREQLREGNRSVLSVPLLQALSDNVKKGEQSILLLNRRGFSTFVSCRSCGEVITCPNCSISLTYHRYNNTLSCHYCGYRREVPKLCPTCKSEHIRYMGTGTEKLEDELHRLLPNVSTLRLDNDTTATKMSHERILYKFQKDNVPILMGTQMVAKGLDFPNVTLVGVIAADAELYQDHYAAGERCFALLTQVFGRAGRADKTGRAIVQTYQPDNEVIQMAARQDYVAFFNNEILFRSAMSYPPYSDIIHLVFSGKNEDEVRVAATAAAEHTMLLMKMSGLHDEITWYGAAPAPISRIDGKYRWRFWLKGKMGKQMIDILEKVIQKHHANKKNHVRISVDVNPNSMQ